MITIDVLMMALQRWQHVSEIDLIRYAVYTNMYGRQVQLHFDCVANVT